MRRFYLALVGMLLPLGAVAFDCSTSGNLTQSEMNACASLEAADAESLLRDVEAYIDRGGDKKSHALRRAARRTWRAFVQAQCNVEADIERGGAIQPLIRSSCSTELTLWQTRRLVEQVICYGHTGNCTERTEWLRKLSKAEKAHGVVPPMSAEE
jgi:uncharacterized protein YecT (DUF1311 family)